jgi:hypothetical protein
VALGKAQASGVIWAASIDDSSRTQLADSIGGAAYAAGWLLSTTPTPRGLVAQPFDPDHLTLRGTPQPVRDRLVGGTNRGDSGFAVSSSDVLVVDRPPAIVHQLVWMDRTGRPIGTVGPSATVNSFALAPDERRVVAETRDPDSLKRDLWLFDPERTTGTQVTYLGAARLPVWGANGRSLYFTTGQGLGPELRVLTVGATTDTTFDKSGLFGAVEDITRDGQYVVLASTAAPRAIWIQPSDHPGERRMLVDGQFSAAQARVSPDRRWLAYTLALPARTDVFVQPFDRPGDRVQVSAAGGSGAVWRDDSRAGGIDGGVAERTRRCARGRHASEAVYTPYPGPRRQPAP